MTEREPPVIGLPRFADAVRASVPESPVTFADFEIMVVDSWIAQVMWGGRGMVVVAVCAELRAI